MPPETVKVHGKELEITVAQKSKSVWIATGKYMNQSLTVQDRTRTTAIKRWIDAAAYRGN